VIVRIEGDISLDRALELAADVTPARPSVGKVTSSVPD
jgi:hypothetical protein